MRIYPETDKYSLEQLMMLAHMEMNEEERLKGWGVELIEKFPPITDYRERVILGSFGWTLMRSKVKMMLRKHVTPVGLNYLTPADIARAYLRIKFGSRKPRMTGVQAQAFVDYRSQVPLYCTPCHISDAMYVDLKSAYWNIVRACGWNCEYMPNEWLGAGDDVSDFPFADHKLARNCLVSCSLPSRMNVWTGTKVVSQTSRNENINLMLWGLVCDVLNGIAADVIRAGAVYVYTDGYICPSNRYDAVSSVIQEWGFPFGVKYDGVCDVIAPANYKFKQHQTRLFASSRPIHYDKIIDRGGDWLRGKFRRFAELRIK